MSIQKIKIAGRTLTVKSESGDDHLYYVVDQLNQRIRETQAVIPDSSESILFVALALMDELVSTQQELDHIKHGAQGKIHHLLNALEAFEKRHIS